MKKLLLLLVLLLPLSLMAQEEQPHDYAKELANYQEQVKTAKGDDLYTAQLGVIRSQYMLDEYMNAAKTAYSTPLPEDPLWKARFLLYRVQTADRVKNIYRPVLNHADEEDASFENLSKEQWADKINQSMETLWSLRSYLIYAPIEKETLVLDVKDTDTKAIPTLFDFVVLKWREYLVKSAPAHPLRTADILTLDYKAKDTKDLNIQKWLYVLTEAATLGGTNREDARIIWQADRITLPFDHQDSFTFEDKDAERNKAIELLEQLSGYIQPKLNWWNKLLSTLRPVNADYGKSYAAYKAAEMLNENKQYEQAVNVCNWADKNLQESYYVQSCANLAAGIRQPVLNLQTASPLQDPAHTQLSIQIRNRSNIYARIYKLSESDLLTLNNEKRAASWAHLTRIDSDQIPQLLKKNPIHKLVKPVSYEKPYGYADTTLALPTLEPGFYAVAVAYDSSFDPEKTEIEVIVLNATELAMFVTTGIEDDPAKYHTSQDRTFKPNVFRIYTVNLKTGQPEPDTNIAYFTGWQSPIVSAKTNDKGFLALAREIHLYNPKYYQITPKATKNNSTALLRDAITFSYYPSAPINFYTETDRAIYRPGQTVQIAVYGFEEAGRGWKTLPEKTPVKILVRDANYEKAFEQNLFLNAYGTAQTQFTLPQTGLLGNYHIEVSYKSSRRTYTRHSSFKVEEYKRPEYEVTLNPVGTLQYNKETTVSGKALYYFGAPLENAEVEYTITRQLHRLPFCWWWPSAYESKQIAQGKTKTRKDGTFDIAFTPQPGEQKNRPYSFDVKVSVRDDSGRSIDASQTYKASEKEAFFAASFDQGFYDANTTATLARVKLLDVNSQPVSGKFTAEIIELENTLPKTATKENNSFENVYKDNKVLRSISKQTFSFDKEETVLQLPALPEGIYKLKLSAKNAEEAEFVFFVAAPQSKLALPSVAIAQYKTYYPGNQAKILIGNSQLIGPKYIEVYQDSNFLAKRDQIESGVSIYTLPIENEWRGGVGLRWFGASNWKMYQEDTYLTVPHDNKALNLNVTVPQAVKPGQKVNWPITLTNATGAPLNGQATVRVYDKSLDYYAAIKQVFGLDNFYPIGNLATSLTNSFYTAYSSNLSELPDIYKEVSEPQMPQINLEMRFMGYRYSLGMAKGAVVQMAVRSAAPRAAKSAVTNDAMDMIMGMEESALPTRGIASDAKEDGANNAEVTPRTDFSETAYFNALLPITGGKGKVNFTMPQSLTGWNVQALAFTKDANIGTFTAQTVTRKDVMVRLSLPRFWRETDRSTLVAQVTNVTDKKITTQVTLDFLLDGKNAAAAFGLEKLTQTVTVPANGNTAVTWPLTVAPGVGVATVTATVRSGQNTDAESRQIPILPAKERIAESTTAALETGSQTLRLENLLTADNTRQVSEVTLRVDPSLFLSVLNTMPQLLRPGYNDALSITNRYVPLSILNAFYQTYPLLQNAVKKLPRRNTQVPAWNNTDPARLLLLEETPWLQLSRGGASRADFLTDIFNPKMVASTRDNLEKQLKKYQTSSGGFTWMPGGQPSEYITLSILASYAQILRYGGQISQDSAKKALAWLAPRIEKNLQESSPSVSAVSYALYSAYVFTAYPQTWKEIKNAPVKKWLDYADAHSDYMTALGQTYAAAAYHRLGQNTKAQNYLDLVLARMKTDPVTGAYFAPEAQSWLWYNDTLLTQTATLRTLLEIRPESDKAADLLKWILFNRKAQQWRDTTAAAQAVYTLLEYMQRKGLIDDPAQYIIEWGDEHKTVNFEPMEFSSPLTWTKEAQNVNPQYYTAQVTKRGGLTGFVTLDAVYTTANAAASQPGVLNVSRRYLLKYNEEGREKVRQLQVGEEIPVGAEVEVQLTLNASAAFEFVLLADPKPAGFENTVLTSGWTWNALSYYTEIRDGQTNFFFDRVPAGTYTLRYTLRPSLQGTYHALPAQLQSMYAPEFSAHTAANVLDVKK